MGRGPGFVLVLLVLLLPGCVFWDEPFEVALRVADGERVLLTDRHDFSGSVVVESGGLLVLQNASVHVSQALVVQGGTIESHDSTVTFAGVHERQDFVLSGRGLFTDSALEGVRFVDVVSGELALTRTRLHADTIALREGDLRSTDSAWVLGGAVGIAMDVLGGNLSFVGGDLDFRAGELGISQKGGLVALANATVGAGALNRHLVEVVGGSAELRGLDVELSLGTGMGRATGGTLRLVDTPFDVAAAPTAESGGRLELGWTLTVRAVALPGNIPVGGLPVTLTSSWDPSITAAEGTTGDDGIVQLVALEAVVDDNVARSGNPHAVRGEGGGKRGAVPAVVVEGPTTVTMPVV